MTQEEKITEIYRYKIAQNQFRKNYIIAILIERGFSDEDICSICGIDEHILKTIKKEIKSEYV